MHACTLKPQQNNISKPYIYFEFAMSRSAPVAYSSKDGMCADTCCPGITHKLRKHLLARLILIKRIKMYFPVGPEQSCMYWPGADER